MSVNKYIMEIKRDLSNQKNWTRYRFLSCPKIFETLDETLDSGRTELAPIECELDFKPFTPVRLRAYTVPRIDYDIDGKTDDELAALVSAGAISLDKTLYLCISDAAKDLYAPRYDVDATEPYKMLWRHSFNLVEPTKIIERRPGGVLCFTNPLNKGYTAETKEIIYNAKQNETANSGIAPAIQMDEGRLFAIIDEWGQPPKLISPLNTGGSVFFDLPTYSTNNSRFMECYWILTDPNSEEKKLTTAKSIILNRIGQWKARLFIKVRYTSGQAIDKEGLVSLIYIIDVVADDSADYTVTEVFERILSAARTRKLSMPQEFYLNGYDPQHTLDGVDNETEKFSKIRAPEIVVEGTLWDMLLSAASYIHYIPRLNYNPKTERFDVITLDELGGNEVAPPVPERVLAFSKSIGINDYCGEVDCTAENLINTQDERAGAVVEPFIGGWKSVRSDGTVDISTDTALFKNTYPHYRIMKLEVRNAKAKEEADITPYLYEAAEWSALDNYSQTFPLSRAYAVKYEQGGQVINELQHKVESTSDSIAELLKEHSIRHILERVGMPLPINFNYNDLQFRATYIPELRMRVTQKKAYIDDDYEGNALYYNQPEAQVECDSFGRGIAGYVEKIGNGEVKATFLFNSIKDIPKTGQLLTVLGETGYVTNVNLELDFKVKATVILSPNYNRLYEAYSGVKSNKRYADVSEKQSYYRAVNYGEDIIIGDKLSGAAQNSMFTSSGRNTFMSVFDPGRKADPASVVTVVHRSKSGNNVARLVMPLITSAAGRAMTFSWAYKNNYGAEDQSIEVTDDLNRRAQREVRIGNLNGQFQYMDAAMYPYLTMTVEQSQKIAHSFPEMPSDYDAGSLGAYLNIPDLIIDHDNREQLSVTIEAHCRTNRRDMILGAALTGKNPLVRGSGDLDAPILFYFACRLNKLNSILSKGFVASFGTASGSVPWITTEDDYVRQIHLRTNSGDDALSWAVLQPINSDGELVYYQIILGENAVVASGNRPRDVFVSFTDNNRYLSALFDDEFYAMAIGEPLEISVYTEMFSDNFYAIAVNVPTEVNTYVQEFSDNFYAIAVNVPTEVNIYPQIFSDNHYAVAVQSPDEVNILSQYFTNQSIVAETRNATEISHITIVFSDNRIVQLKRPTEVDADL